MLTLSDRIMEPHFHKRSKINKWQSRDDEILSKRINLKEQVVWNEPKIVTYETIKLDVNFKRLYNGVHFHKRSKINKSINDEILFKKII